MPSAFGAAPRELLIDNDTGVNATLAKLHGQYEAKAQWLELLGCRPDRDGMYYERAAGAIAVLQLQGRVPGQLYAAAHDGKAYTFLGEVTDLYFTVTAKVYNGETLVDTIPNVPVQL